MNLFQKVKQEVDFLEAMEYYIGTLKQCGDDTYTTEEDECPIHHGHGCFRIKVAGEDSIVNCFGNCDHDTWPLDLIGFVQLYKGLETPADSARLIAKDFGIKMTVEGSSTRILRAAKDYYRSIFEMNIKKIKTLGKRTPLEYQLNVRNHKEETLEVMQIGWSDGNLIDELEDHFTKEELLASGLFSENKKSGKLYDFIPSNSFVYPHFWNGQVSRFTWKRSDGGKEYQMRKLNWLNDIRFFSVGSGQPVAVVEGENDLASLLDDEWPGTILCTNGSLSKEQIEWVVEHPAEYHTFWDGDEAGDKYADKFWRAHIAGRIPNLTQWAIPKDSDIDVFLQEYELSDLKALEPPAREDIVNIVERECSNIIEKNGCYHLINVSKDGETETHVQITDFLIKLLYVKVQGEERSRVVRIIRNDGRKSKPVVVNSEAKVSVRHWKILVANAVDASFTGSEVELAAMWTYVYSTQREAVVDVPSHVGNLEGDGWLFGNQYIGPDGDIEGDDDNIMWFNDSKTRGVAPKSLLASLGSTNKPADIPNVWRGEDTDTFIGDVVFYLNEVLKDPGIVLTLMGWMRSNAYSMPLFYNAKIKFFPFLLLWGRHGRGKSTLANWMLSMYDMSDKGTTTVGQLRSGVGIERKLSFYRGLPYCIDELRADRQASEYSRTWRGWYNRSSRVKGTRKSEEVIQVPLNANLFFSGQDTFTDPAMRSRCIPLKFPPNAGDPIAYNWLEDKIDDFPTIGYHWIREAMTRQIDCVKDDIDAFKDGLKEITPLGISSRSIANYAMIGYFAKDMAERYFPDFDYYEWLSNAMTEEHVEAIDNDMVSTFWDGIAGLQIGDHPPLNGNHMTVRDDKLYVWYAEVFKVVANSNRGEAREAFSKGAVRDALVEEPYYSGTRAMRLGATNTSRRCLVFDLEGTNVPAELLSVAETAQNSF